MKTKEQVIQEAYGVDWDKLSDETKESVINQNGYILFYLVSRTKESPYYEMVGNGFARPKSLRGIEYNNEWIKLDDLNTIDKVAGYDCSIYKLHLWTNGGYYEYKDYLKWQTHYNNLIITHYKLEIIEDIKPPIY